MEQYAIILFRYVQKIGENIMNNKYNKVLTILLIVLIVAIVGILICLEAK